MTAPTTPDLSWRRGEEPWLDPFLPALRAAGVEDLEALAQAEPKLADRFLVQPACGGKDDLVPFLLVQKDRTDIRVGDRHHRLRDFM